MSSKTLVFDDIGEIDFYKNKRAKYLKIALNHEGRARVTVPYRANYRQAYDFVESKLDWIRENIEKIKQKRPDKLLFDNNTVFNTKFHRLNLIAYKGNDCKIILNRGEIEFFYPEKEDIHGFKIQNSIKSAIVETLRREAKCYLTERLEEFAQKYSFKYKKVFIKNLKSRWGSCSSQDNINLNLHLMRLPDYLIDYVLLHELVHTVEKNHGENFWNLLGRFIPEAKNVDKQLKRFRIELF